MCNKSIDELDKFSVSSLEKLDISGFDYKDDTFNIFNKNLCVNVTNSYKKNINDAVSMLIQGDNNTIEFITCNNSKNDTRV